MKISIVTVVYNAQATILDTLEAVAKQTHADVEHIVIDGASTDATLQRIAESPYQPAHVVSEVDSGIYDAMNKGIALASGAVIGLLNADDVYQNSSVLAQVATVMENPELDACYADLVYVKPNDLSAVTRYWRSREYKKGLCFRGWMPAHPTFFLRRSAYQKVGPYRVDLRYQSDLEFCARAFERHHIRTCHVPELWVRMRLGGVTNNSLMNMWRGNWESYRALKALGMRRNPLWYFCLKFGAKIPQFMFRR